MIKHDFMAKGRMAFGSKLKKKTCCDLNELPLPGFPSDALFCFVQTVCFHTFETHHEKKSQSDSPVLVLV